MKAIEFLNKTIGEYNKTANNIAKFQFNDKESEMFAQMMDDYADLRNKHKPTVLVVDASKPNSGHLIKALESQSMPNLEIMLQGKLDADRLELSISPQLVKQPLTRKERRKNKSKEK